MRIQYQAADTVWREWSFDCNELWSSIMTTVARDVSTKFLHLTLEAEDIDEYNVNSDSWAERCGTQSSVRLEAERDRLMMARIMNHVEHSYFRG